MLKIAGVKSEKEFYDKFPDEASFMAKHGKEFKKAMRGSKIDKAQVGQQVPQLPGANFQPTLQYVPSNTPMYNPYVTPRPTTRTAGLPRTQLGDVKNLGTRPAVSSTPTEMASPTGIAPYVGAGMDVIQGISMLKQQRDTLRQYEQQAALANVFDLAASSIPIQPDKREYVRPEDVVFEPEQMSPSYGVGTNILAQDGTVIRNNIGGTPTEIQNTFAPNTIYTDMGFEPLNDTSKIKQYVAGGKLKKAKIGNQMWMQDTKFGNFMMNEGGIDTLGSISGAIQGEQEAGSKIGKGIGTAAGTALGGPIGGAIGGFLGETLGGIVDPTEEKIKRYQQQTSRSMGNIAGRQVGMNVKNIFGNVMQDGGETSPYKWVSHTWQPRTITQFGEYKMKDLLKPPHDADMLRAGGHLKEYTPPSERAMSTERPNMQMGGELQTHWGGYAEPMSYNPYLPDGGETIMFRGQSHDESDGQGNTGIGITYGDNPVEVERGEPAVKLKDGTSGDSNLTVFGNINITKAFASMLGDSKAQGKKFKTYVADLSKQENKQNKLIDKSVEQLDDMNVQSSFDKLALGTLQANIEGANAKLKDLAEKKMDAAALQNAINDSKEEDLLNVTDSGEVLAKKGASIPKAQGGISRGKSRAELRNVDPAIQGLLDLLSRKNYDVFATSGYRDSATRSGRPSRHSTGEAMDVSFPTLGDKAYEAILNDPEVASYMLQNNITAINEYDPAVQQQTGASGPHIHFGFDKGTALADRFRKEASAKYPDALTPISSTGLPNVSPEDYSYLKNLYDLASKEPNKTGPAVLKFQQEFHRIAPDYARSVLGKYPTTTYGKKKGLEATDLSQNLDSIFGQRTQQYMAALDAGMKDAPTGEMAKVKELQEVILPSGKKATAKDVRQLVVNPYKRSLLLDAFNRVLPYLRPSDVEELDARQLLGEMYALSTNQVEPVYAQKFMPQLSTPVDVSLQDILNQNQADYNATQRLVGYNPEALSMLNAQKYQANQRVLGEQFRMNQAERQRVYEQNRNLLNEADLVNLKILDRQQERQATALSKTKETTRRALESISDKFLKNRLQNRTLATAQNLFNYRYDPSFRTVNMNPLWQPDIPNVGGALPIYDKNNKVVGYKSIEETTGVQKPATTDPALQNLLKLSTDLQAGKKGISVKKSHLNSSVVKAFKKL